MSVCIEAKPETQHTDDTTSSVAHVFCPWCYPNPQLGDTITALCGTQRHYLGRRTPTSDDCLVCRVHEARAQMFRACPNCLR